MTVHSSHDDARTVQFVRAAESYCALLDSLSVRDGSVSLPALHGALVELYAAVLVLPPRSALQTDEPLVGRHDPSLPPRYTLVTFQMRDALALVIAAWLGDANHFVDVVDPFAPDAELIPVSLGVCAVRTSIRICAPGCQPGKHTAWPLDGGTGAPSSRRAGTRTSAPRCAGSRRSRDVMEGAGRPARDD